MCHRLLIPTPAFRGDLPPQRATLAFSACFRYTVRRDASEKGRFPHGHSTDHRRASGARRDKTGRDPRPARDVSPVLSEHAGDDVSGAGRRPALHHHGRHPRDVAARLHGAGHALCSLCGRPRRGALHRRRHRAADALRADRPVRQRVQRRADGGQVVRGRAGAGALDLGAQVRGRLAVRAAAPGARIPRADGLYGLPDRHVPSGHARHRGGLPPRAAPRGEPLLLHPHRLPAVGHAHTQRTR